MAEQTAHRAPEPDPGRRQAQAALAGLLETGDEADRCHACQALGTIGSPEWTPALIARLRDEDVDVCVDAAGALGQLEDRTAVPALLESLRGDPDGEVKTAVLEALARLGGSDACEALLEVAARRPEGMPFDDTDPWDAWWDMQLKAVEALGRMGVAGAAPVLDGILDDEEGQDIDTAVLKSLALIGQEGEQRLVRRLTRSDARGRRRAAAALGHARTPSAIQRLAGALLDKAPEVRVAAVEALGGARAVQFLPAIALLHRDEDPEVRAAAARAATELAATADANTLPMTELAALASDPAPEVQRVALAALARAPAVPDTLLESVESALLARDEHTALAACQVLGRFANEASCARLLEVLADADRPPRVRSAAARSAATAGVCDDAVLAGLTRAVGDSDQGVRLAALSALMDLGARWQPGGQDPPGVPGTRPRTPHAVVLAALAGRLLPPEVPLEVRPSPDAAAEDPSHETTSTHSQSTEDPGQGSAAKPPGREPRTTLEAIAAHNVEVALGADPAPTPDNEPHSPAEAMEDDPELHPYLELVESNERTARWLFARGTGPVAGDVRRLAARVIGGAGFARALPALLECLGDDDKQLRKEAAASIALIAATDTDLKTSGATLAPLETACEDADRDLRAAAARALGALGERSCAPTLKRLLGDSDPAVRIQAVHALGALAPAGSGLADDHPDAGGPLADLLSMLTDRAPGVRKAALAALASLFETAGMDLQSAARASALEQVLDAGFAGDGTQARDAARTLRCIDPEAAAGHAVARLATLPTSVERRVAIEILQELYKA